VNASDEDGSILSVRVLLDGEAYDTAVEAPYNFSWATISEPAGVHSITAVAEDNEGKTATHEIKVNVITDVEPVLPCPGGINISYEGQIYNTVQIGDQCWLKENMNVATANSVYYNDDQGNGATYGRLYTWEEAMTACPPGWHVPTSDEWCTLTMHADATATCTPESETGTDAGFKLKSAGGWADEHHGSDQFGFRARPGGYKSGAGNYEGLGKNAMFWSATESPDGSVYSWSMTNETTKILNHKAPKTEFRSVRCIRD
jgi:uncharacterized protein (TIGR02145 family)